MRLRWQKMTDWFTQANGEISQYLSMINADWVSAIATLLATVVALWLPGRTAKKEWARQDRLIAADHQREDRLRTEMIAQQKEDRKYVIHQGASTVDQILAYWHAALVIGESEPVYHEGFAAIRRLRENVLTLKEILMIMRVKPELSDGLIFTIVNADRIAEDILNATRPPQNGQSQDWIQWRHNIERNRSLVEMTQKRNNEVRAAFQIQSSLSAQSIRNKYATLSQAIVHAKVTNGALDMTAVPQNHY